MTKIAIVRSSFNETVTEGLLHGAKAVLSENHISKVELYSAPGAFEIPLIAQRLARSGQYDGVICLGCVIKGDTAHFEFISLGATLGLMQAMLATEVPITFGILTTYTEEQADIRSRREGELAAHNKGREAATACLETLRTLSKIRAVTHP